MNKILIFLCLVFLYIVIKCLYNSIDKIVSKIVKGGYGHTYISTIKGGYIENSEDGHTYIRPYNIKKNVNINGNEINLKTKKTCFNDICLTSDDFKNIKKINNISTNLNNKSTNLNNKSTDLNNKINNISTDLNNKINKILNKTKVVLNYNYNAKKHGIQKNMVNLQVRTNQVGQKITALGRTKGPGQGVIKISNNKNYNRVKGYLKVRAAGTTDGWISNSQSITGTTFMDGIAITGIDNNNNEKWLYGVVFNNWNGIEYITRKPSVVGDNYSTVLTHHKTYPSNNKPWFDYNDKYGNKPYKTIYIDRILPNTFKGNIYIRIMSNQHKNNEDAGIEECNLILINEN